ncbi:MAG: AMP-binding protein, partial [Myxococcales bacterium]|nr:AMP-binding protein [Myxococcales bacterium]
MADFDDIVATFRGHVARDPAAPAIAWFDARARVTEQHDRAGYLARCEGLAGALRARGVEPGERVLLIHPPGLAFFEALVACLIAGA